MKTRISLLSSACLLLAACNSTTTNEALKVEDAPYLTAEQIKTQIIGNTMTGTAIGRTGTRYPYKLHLQDGKYQDRILVNGKPQRATGTYFITDDGRICTNVKAYRNGNTSCQKYQPKDGKLLVVDVSEDYQLKPHLTTIEPGLTF